MQQTVDVNSGLLEATAGGFEWVYLLVAPASIIGLLVAMVIVWIACMLMYEPPGPMS